ncbi:MAG: hypothetical protein B7Z66_14825 [Chromatiales bacterium 21-64-14]|nr:MAG: hypothetical protein B7Z66_14825 [Chromatiales bacterium 21-64-14]
MAQKRWKKRLGLVLGRRRLLRDASFLHVLNEDEGKLLEPLRLGTPMVVVPNGVFAAEVGKRPNPGRFYLRYPQLENSPYILFLSRLHYKKGLDFLAAMFAKVASAIPEVRLVVVGPDGGALADFEGRVRNAGFANRVLVTGPLYGSAKSEALADAACFCLPSRQEGFSMAITEALAIGCPVLITENCHFPEVATAGAGLVVPLSVAELADAASRILRSSALRTRMGQEGLALVRKSYTWERISEYLEAAYRRHFRTR